MQLLKTRIERIRSLTKIREAAHNAGPQGTAQNLQGKRKYIALPTEQLDETFHACIIAEYEQI